MHKPLTVENAKPGTTIICAANPEWGRWVMRRDGEFWVIRGDAGTRVLAEGEFKFWEVVGDSIEVLRDHARQQSTMTIRTCVIMLTRAGTPEERLARAALIDVYQERTSEAEADALMDLIGL